MIKSILVPLDGSQAAEAVLPYVELIAPKAGSGVTLLSVLAEGQDNAEAQRYLDKTAERLRGAGVDCSSETASGPEAAAILERAEAENFDLIAMSTHGRSGLMRWVLGSVADKVLHGTDRPLLLVRAGDDVAPPGEITNILVPLDGSALAASVLPYVEELAGSIGAELVLYNAVLPLDVYPGAELTPARMGDLLDDLVTQGRAYVGAVAGEVEGRGKTKAKTVVTIGFPVDEIVRVAGETDSGLIAMASHGRSGVNRWVMGSVADGVVRRSKHPCLLVHPPQASQEG
jgi:nucleotide-binding universal stress UspA family protein